MHRAARIDGTRETDPLPPPGLGEHTERILLQAGIDAREIETLRAAAIV